MIDLQVRHESGDIVARSPGVHWEQLAGLDPAEFPLLVGVCPFADTVFNAFQRPMLLAELDRLDADRSGPWVDAVRDMCRIAEEVSHRYVWFVGD